MLAKFTVLGVHILVLRNVMKVHFLSNVDFLFACRFSNSLAQRQSQINPCGLDSVLYGQLLLTLWPFTSLHKWV
jgi:hypothetical protein